MPTEEWNDEMHRLIVDRLKERNRKLEVIKRCEKTKKGSMVSIASLLVAACLIGLIFNLAINKSNDMDGEPIRSSIGSVQKLLDEKRYDEALIFVEKEMGVVDSTLNELRKNELDNDEEAQYEVQAMELRLNALVKERDAILEKIK